MGLTTWVDRITDESNLWLSACKAEEAGDYSSAAALYLDDAAGCLGRTSNARAALSSYCAAECFAALGASSEADWFYSEAGRLYAGIAVQGVAGSIREALWALQRAYACFVLAEDPEESGRVLESYRLLVRRANPFSLRSSWLEMPEPATRPEALPGSRGKLDAKISRAIENFFAQREPESSKAVRRVGPGQAGHLIHEQESFVSQLG